MKRFLQILRFIRAHPLAGRNLLKAYWRFFSWQLSQRLSPHTAIYQFTPHSKLALKRKLIGATGNLYVGLHDFSEMGFLLHFLRPSDLFADIGANVGTYTVLASGEVKARTISFEPIPSTADWLRKNIEVNKMDHLVKVYPIGLGSKQDVIRFTSDFDAENRVVSKYEEKDQYLEVKVESFDSLFYPESIPLLMKIDVEGFESEVLKGMKKTLVDKHLKAIIIELNGSGYRYGFDEKHIHQQLLEAGFQPYGYDPYSRQLEQLLTFGSNNTVYMRDLDFIKMRLKEAGKLKIFGQVF
jgi:FkbM family methyltransferase